MRRIPELHFELDRVLAEAQRIERPLREALPPEGSDAGEAGEPGDREAGNGE
jgi:hypothetical protein